MRYSRDLGYIKVAGVVPPVKPGDLEGNAASLVKLYHKASRDGADICLFPELCLTGYTLGDLFLQDQLIRKTEEALTSLLEATEQEDSIMVIGLPLSLGGLLFNAGLVIQQGRILGAVPKTYLPNTREFYEQRWFASSRALTVDQAHLAGQHFPVGRDMVFLDPRDPRFSFALEICEDLWAPLPPGTWHSLAGASLILNLSASNDLVGKQDYRSQLVSQQSARSLGGYAYVSAGPGESTTDIVYSGRVLMYENGHRLAESEPFHRKGFIMYADMDVQALDKERRDSSSFRQSVEEEAHRLRAYKKVDCLFPQRKMNKPQRPLDAHPFVPSNPEEREKRCREIFAIQSEGLVTRLKHIGCRDTVLGLSGGLDSTLALLVLVEAYKRCDYPLSGIHAYTLPGFGTTDRTLNNAVNLCKELGIPLETVDISDACLQQFKDLNHSPDARDITYENVQARQRTQFLMNKANQQKAIVIGTGDLSELALGWCTYNGDHMSMYAVNTGVPKTLVRYLVEYVAHSYGDNQAAAILTDIADTPISPELLPPDDKGEIAQKTESLVGPYELHDFFLYQVVRCGFPPAKVQFLAEMAFEGSYDPAFIKKWLENFYRRFFGQQFKRSCLPDGPKVGSLCLSPRGDWRMPSDASVKSFLTDI